jgi:hypothetical protein
MFGTPNIGGGRQNVMMARAGIDLWPYESASTGHAAPFGDA